MATISFGSGTLPGAPGTYINERAGNISTAAISTFNTAYMLVEVEDSVPVTRFPYNTPIAITSLDDYRALIGGIPTERVPLLSYDCVNETFLNAQVGDVRVVRVGTPTQIAEIEFLPSGTKINSTGLPSALEAGDVVYIQMILNGQRLVAGDGSTGYTSNGDWLGVPVTIPVDYIAGDEVNNRKISSAIVRAFADAIESNPSIRSAVYVRDYGLVTTICPETNSENGYAVLAATTFDGTIQATPEQFLVGAASIFMTNTYDIGAINCVETSLERVPQDYIQCIRTAFDGQQDQGYLYAPTAYAQFDAAGRAAVGAATASHCESNEFKWMGLADAGPFLVTDINKYKTYTPHQAAEDLVAGLKYLVDNAIYEWTGNDVTYTRLPYQSLVPSYNPEVAVKQSKASVADSQKVGIVDSSKFTLVSAIGSAEEGVFYVDDPVWPVGYDIQEVTISNVGADFTGLLPVGETSGTVYIVAPPYNSDLYGPYPSDGASQYVYLTSTASEATAVLTAVLAAGGTALVGSGVAAANGAFVVSSPTGSNADITYSVSAWNWPTTINGQTSNLVQNISGGTQGVNTLHLPATLQKSTKDYRLNFVSRVIFDANNSINSYTFTGGTQEYAAFSCDTHGLVNGQRVYFTQPIKTDAGDVLFKQTLSNTINPYFVKVIDNDTFVLATSYTAYLSGSYVTFPSDSIVSKPTVLYSKVLGGNLTSVNLSELTTLPLIRARKYGINSGIIANEAASSASAPAPSSDNPDVFIYLNRSSKVLGQELIFPYGETTSADWLPSLVLNNPGSTTTTTANYICTPTVDQNYTSEAYLVPAIGPIFGGSYEANTTASTGSLDSVTDYTDALGLTVSDSGTDIQNLLQYLGGVYFNVTSAPSGSKAPDGTTPVVIGDRIAVVYNGSSYEWVVIPAASLGGDLSSVGTVCHGAQVEVVLADEQTPTSNLWNFDAITSTEIIDEALRGVGNAGVPEAVFIEAGVDNTTRLLEDSQRYFNAYGFIAFDGSYILNSSGRYVPLSPYRVGVALRRYRSEGFQFPPAGTKYQLVDAVAVQIPVNSAQQNLLNPRGCNVARALPGYSNTAIFIWAARTRVNTANAEQRKFQFINTRVIQNVVYGSLRRAWDNQIFSIVDGIGVTFNQITTIGNSVMSQLYTAGALFGAIPSEAFEVVCDERINSAANLENGIINVQVFDVPVPTLERIDAGLFRVTIGQMSKELESRGLS